MARPPSSSDRIFLYIKYIPLMAAVKLENVLEHA
jgi:hypothetical protein